MADVTVKELRAKPGAWVDLGLTLPLFVVYHLGVVFFYEIAGDAAPLINEEELTLLGEYTAGELRQAEADGMNLESWSKLILADIL
jgi:hypothetical protein